MREFTRKLQMILVLISIMHHAHCLIGSHLHAVCLTDKDRVLTALLSSVCYTICYHDTKQQQVLAHRKDKPTNDFEAKAIGAYLRACEVSTIVAHCLLIVCR
jgi:hypothetical protein